MYRKRSENISNKLWRDPDSEEKDMGREGCLFCVNVGSVYSYIAFILKWLCIMIVTYK